MGAEVTFSLSESKVDCLSEDHQKLELFLVRLKKGLVI